MQAVIFQKYQTSESEYEVYKKGLATATAPAGASFGGELEDE